MVFRISRNPTGISMILKQHIMEHLTMSFSTAGSIKSSHLSLLRIQRITQAVKPILKYTMYLSQVRL